MSEALRPLIFDLGEAEAPPWESPVPPRPDPKPRLLIPGDNRLVSRFAAELAEHLAQAGIYNLNGTVVMENPARAALETVAATKFVTWIEDWVLCYRVKGDQEFD